MDPQTLKFTESHEWVSADGDVAIVGLSRFAVDQLSDLVLIDLPKVGAQATAGKRLGEVESVKSVNDIYAPVSGEVVEVNSAVADDVAILSSEPYGAGWLVKIRMSDPSALGGLLGYDDYQKTVAEH